MIKQSYKRIFEENKIWGDAFCYQFDKNEANTKKQTTKILDEICRLENLEQLGSAWKPIESRESLKLLKNALRFDLAYPAFERLDEGLAEELISELLKVFNFKNSRIYTNCLTDPWNEENEGYGWNPLTNHTFDIGMAFVDGQKLFFIYFISED